MQPRDRQHMDCAGDHEFIGGGPRQRISLTEEEGGGQGCPRWRDLLVKNCHSPCSQPVDGRRG